MDMSKFNLITHDEAIVKLIAKTSHKDLVRWAIQCLEHERHLLDPSYLTEQESIDTAIFTLELWINDKITMWEARKYCWKVLELARNIDKEDKVACQILRAASHTLATCHVRTHAEGSAMYTVSALQHSLKDDPQKINKMTDLREWQIKQLKNYSKK